MWSRRTRGARIEAEEVADPSAASCEGGEDEDAEDEEDEEGDEDDEDDEDEEDEEDEDVRMARFAVARSRDCFRRYVSAATTSLGNNIPSSSSSAAISSLPP